VGTRVLCLPRRKEKTVTSYTCRGVAATLVFKALFNKTQLSFAEHISVTYLENSAISSTVKHRSKRTRSFDAEISLFKQLEVKIYK